MSIVMTSAAIRKSVFIVDDEPKVLKAMAQTVAELGCTITCFQDANECLTLLKEKQQACDLVITDIRMAGMDGLTFLKEIKNVCPFVPVVMVTGYADVPVAIRAIR